MYYYSPLTKGFYVASIHGDSIPKDAVEINDATYESLMNSQSAGKIIVPDSNGNPIATDRGKSWPEIQSMALDELRKSDTTVIRCIENGVTIPGAWVSYRKSLRDIISTSSGDPGTTLPVAPSFPQGT